MDATKAFAAVSEAYAQYRPTYPASLFTAILDHNPALGVGGKRQVAVDVACGSGQATLPLALLFERVVACDSSPEQLAAARGRIARASSSSSPSSSSAAAAAAAAAAARLELREADAHATGLPDASADLVAVAQALHWFDVPRFAAEAARLLRPHGSLAAWSYGLASVVSVAGAGGARRGGGGGGETDDDQPRQEQPQDQPEQAAPSPPPPPPPLSAGAGAAEAADAALRHLYESLHEYWDARRSHVDDGYARLQQQLDESSSFARVERRMLEMRAWRTVEELAGYVASWSGVARARAARRAAKEAAKAATVAQEGEEEEDDEDEDPVAAFRRDLVRALGGAEDASLELVTPITLVLACEPRRQ